MPDPYHGAMPPRTSYVNGAPVTPDDAIDLPIFGRALWIGTSGTLTVLLRNAAAPITLTVAASTDRPLELYVRRVYETGTSATNIIALW